MYGFGLGRIRAPLSITNNGTPSRENDAKNIDVHQSKELGCCGTTGALTCAKTTNMIAKDRIKSAQMNRLCSESFLTTGTFLLDSIQRLGKKGVSFGWGGKRVVL
jgi:hypothetical protein